MNSESARSHGFEEEEDAEVASLVAMEAGFSGLTHDNSRVSWPASTYQDSSDKHLSSSSPKKQPSSFSLDHSLSASSSRPARFSGRRYEDRRPARVYFLEFCFLCMKRLSHGQDIFMYRDSAYCSEECRERKMEIDEVERRELNQVSMRNKEETKTTKDASLLDSIELQNRSLNVLLRHTMSLVKNLKLFVSSFKMKDQ